MSVPLLLGCLLVLAPGTIGQANPSSAGAAAATAGPALPLPANPTVECRPQVFYEATSKDLSCGRAVWSYDTPTAGCCSALSDYFGPNSTRPSRNCLCVPEVSERFFLANIPTDDYTTELINFSGLLASCELLGFEIAYWSNDLGPCAGLPASTIPTTLLASTTKPKRSFGAWVRYLRHDGVLGLAFAVGLLSALGFLLMAWPVVFDAAMTIAEMSQSLRERRQMKAGVMQPYTSINQDSPLHHTDVSHKLQS